MTINFLTAAMDNGFAARLGEICTAAASDKGAGDMIDRGLILRRLLEESGFLLSMSGIGSAGHVTELHV